MQITVVRPSELGSDEIAAWHSMQRLTPSLANPCLSPEFALAVDNFRPGARVAVLSDGPVVVGFFPFERRRLGVGVPIGAGMNECQGVVHAPAVEWNSSELLRACKITVWHFDHLVDGQRPFDRYRVAAAPSPVIDLADGFPAYLEKLEVRSPQFCKDLVRKTRKLEREVGQLRFVVDSREVTALRTLMRWKSQQYQRKGWYNVFDELWKFELVDYLFSTHCDKFGGLLSVLYAGDDAIAAHFGLRSGHVLAHWFPAYDARYSKHSPGLIQHLRMAQETAAIGIHQIDMGTGAQRYKETFKSYDLFVSQGVVARGSFHASVYRLRRVLQPPVEIAVGYTSRQIKRHAGLFRRRH